MAEAYKKKTTDVLKEELRKRGLPLSGRKDDLVARLVENDAASATLRESVAAPHDAAAAAEDDESPPKKCPRKEAPEPAGEKKAPAAIGATTAVSVPATVASGGENEMSFFPEGQWKEALKGEFSQPYFKQMLEFVAKERASKTVFPPVADVFNAFRFTPLEDVKVVIIGQDPYFNKGEAHGLCFSVQRGVKVPPSLNRIYNVLIKTVPQFGTEKPKHGCLEKWARNGVFMLNATLTVVEKAPNSHKDCGWQRFTDAVIRVLNERCDGIIYMLWGKFAEKKGNLVDRKKAHVLVGPHPSPMSGEQWNSCKHFAEANTILTKAGKKPLDWKVD